MNDRAAISTIDRYHGSQIDRQDLHAWPQPGRPAAEGIPAARYGSKRAKVGNGILLEPIEKKFDYDEWRAKLDAMGAKDFLPEGRPEQPQWPEDDDVSFD